MDQYPTGAYSYFNYFISKRKINIFGEGTMMICVTANPAGDEKPINKMFHIYTAGLATNVGSKISDPHSKNLKTRNFAANLCPLVSEGIVTERVSRSVKASSPSVCVSRHFVMLCRC